MRKTLAVLVLTATTLLVAGCSGGSAAPATTVTTTVTASPSGSGAATPSGTPLPTSGAGGQVDPNAPAGQCADSALSITVDAAEGGGAAGSVFYNVTFTNTGSTSCVLRGAPGVSIVGDGNGTQLGSPATQTGDTVETVTIAPGQSVGAPLQQVNIGSDGGPLAGGCTVVPGDGYRIYPPHSFTAFFVASAGITACSNAVDWMSVGPVAAL